MISEITKEEHERIDDFLKDKMTDGKTYLSLVNDIHDTEELSLKEKIVASFVAGDYLARIKIADSIMGGYHNE